MNRKTFPLEEIEEAMDSDSGFCTACGAMQDSCEPDARKYHCDECGANEVFGAEELILMRLVR